MSGRLVGINTMIFSQSGGSQGIGFAIPSNLVRLYVESTAAGRKVERPWLGVLLETVNREIAEALGLDRISGAVVSRVSNRGPGAAQGFRRATSSPVSMALKSSDPRAVYYRLTTRGIGNNAGSICCATAVRSPSNCSGCPSAAGQGRFSNLVGPHPFDGARVSTFFPVSRMNWALMKATASRSSRCVPDR